MLEHIKITNIAGKTVKAVSECGDECLITFTDGTFTSLLAEPDCGCNDSSAYLDPEFDRDHFSDWMLEGSGVVTPEETREHLKAEQLRRQAQLEANEKAELARLLAKHGVPS